MGMARKDFAERCGGKSKLRRGERRTFVLGEEKGLNCWKVPSGHWGNKTWGGVSRTPTSGEEKRGETRREKRAIGGLIYFTRTELLETPRSGPRGREKTDGNADYWKICEGRKIAN